MALQLQGHPHDCPRWPFEVGENESTAGANVPHDMPGSTRPVQIIRREVCNPSAWRLPSFTLACRLFPQPFRHPPERLPLGGLENPVHRQGLGVLRFGYAITQEDRSNQTPDSPFCETKYRLIDYFITANRQLM